MSDPGPSAPDGSAATSRHLKSPADPRWFGQTAKSSLHFVQSPGLGHGTGIAMILARYLTREMLTTFVAVLATLMLVVVASRFANYLAAAAAGEVARSYILELVGLKCVDALTPLLPASVFAALVLALGRLERDQEIVAMSAAGMSRAALARTVLAVGIGFAAVAGGLSLAAAPLVSERYESLKATARDSADFTRIVAQRFTRFGRSGPVFYVERITGDGHTMEEVFMHSSAGASDEVILAPRARYLSVPEGRFVVLEDGRRYVGAPGAGKWTITRFARYSVRLQDPKYASVGDRATTMTTARLWSAPAADRSAAAELQWRLSQPILTLVLAGAAFALSIASRGRFDRLLTGALFYLLYLGLVISAAKGVGSGHLPKEVGVWPVHAGFAAVVAILCLRLSRSPRARTAAPA